MPSRPDWSEWILQKNSESQQEELKKSEYAILEKARRIKIPFKHKSKVKLVVATDGKTYHVEETLDPVENDPEILSLREQEDIAKDNKSLAGRRLMRLEDLGATYGRDPSKWPKFFLNEHNTHTDKQNQASMKIDAVRKRLGEREQEILNSQKPPETIFHHEMPFSHIDKFTNDQGFQLRLTNKYDGADSDLYDRYYSGVVDAKHPEGPRITPGDDKPHTPAGTGIYRRKPKA
jgi:hypothetical protein